MKPIEKLSLKRLKAKVAHYLRQAEVLEVKSEQYLQNLIPKGRNHAGIHAKYPHFVNAATDESGRKYCQKKAVELMESAERARANAKRFEDRINEIWESGLHGVRKSDGGLFYS